MLFKRVNGKCQFRGVVVYLGLVSFAAWQNVGVSTVILIQCDGGCCEIEEM